MTVLGDFHAHVYFDEKTVSLARVLSEEARDHFGIAMGRVHEKNVGPHPRWSCQLSVPPEKFGEVVSWLSLNRNGLTLFIHANTGDDLKDHTDHAIWMGEVLDLNLSAFS
ncbi:DOPA 4,5-dioxygenase family protein [Kiloniella antarctica]|uniref:DOPA 4,5-dioxygenase family protein n=1 Tax=Kiloniella antarctica TaxID=1550907 RepID=A0ABW5BP07_9PROT